MDCYYYTFGSDPGYPNQCGWMEIHATSRREAGEKFRARFPDWHENTMNYAFCYDAERWVQMDPEHNLYLKNLIKIVKEIHLWLISTMFALRANLHSSSPVDSRMLSLQI